MSHYRKRKRQAELRTVAWGLAAILTIGPLLFMLAVLLSL